MAKAWHIPLLLGLFLRLDAAPVPDWAQKRSRDADAGRAERIRARFGMDPEGPSHRVVDQVYPRTNALGVVSSVTNPVVVVADGLNYWDGNNWVESDPGFVLKPGYASAVRGQHRVNIGGNINVRGSVALTMPDGTPFRATIHGVAYHDAVTDRSLLIGAVRDAQGYQVSPNRILFKDAFDGVEADVRYTCTRNSLEQDLILRGPVPDPELFGFSAETTELEVWTEVFDAPVPRLRPAPEAVAAGRREGPHGADDAYIDFPCMSIEPGKSYRLGHDMELGALVPVRKRWVEVGGRTFLVESVPLPGVRSTLQQRPVPGPSGASKSARPGRREALLAALPRKADADVSRAVVDARTDGPLLASLEGGTDGLLLDWVLRDTTTPAPPGGWTFQGNETYWVKGLFTVGPFTNAAARLVFEAGTVVKFARHDPVTGVDPTINSDCPVEALGTAYRPVILTAEDDHTVGERLTSSPGPSGYYADQALVLRAWNGDRVFNLQWMRINRAWIPLNVGGGSGHALRHLQVTRSYYGITANAASYRVGNALFSDIGAGVFHTGSGAQVRGEHLTLHNVAGWLGYGVVPTLVNSLLVQVPATPSGPSVGSQGATLTNCLVFPAGTGVFAESFQGGHYLPPESPCRNAGAVGVVDPQLSAELLRLTTDAPVTLPGLLTNNVTLAPRVVPDLDAPDLGYHYAPVDYLAANVRVQDAVVVITNGTAIAAIGSGAFTPAGSGRVVSVGRPEQLNRWALYQAVQENDLGPVTGGPGSAFTFVGGTGNAWTRFTEVSALAGPAWCRALFPETFNGPLVLVDSHVRGISWRAWNNPSANYTRASINVTNSILERCSLDFEQGVLASQLPFHLPVALRNCLVLGSDVRLKRSTSAYGAWTLCDNLFSDSPASLAYFKAYSAVETLSNNGYTGTTTPLGGTGNVTGLVPDFVRGPLGDFYYPAPGASNSLAGLVDMGLNANNATAATAGLYHHTVQATGTREGTSRMDIGFHYVATATWASSTQFARSPTNGNWSYAYVPSQGPPSLRRPMSWDPTNAVYAGVPNDLACQAWATGMHPGAATDPVASFLLPRNARVSFHASVTDGNAQPGVATADGVMVRVLVDDQPQAPWRSLVEGARNVPISGALSARAGQFVHFQLNRNRYNPTDTTLWNPVVAIDVPVDSDNDGVPDYQEDANGNGVTETATETSFLSPPIGLRVASARIH